MADAGNIYAYDKNGSCMGLLKILKSEEIGQDICYSVPDFNDREVDYICYIDKCGCSCCLPLEDELIIHQTQGEIKDISLSGLNGTLNTKRSEIYGNNWNKTVVRYKLGGYPSNLTDGTLLVEEMQKNQYSSSAYSKSGFTTNCTYYLKFFGVDNNGEIINSNCSCVCIKQYINCSYGYTGDVQSITLTAGTYKLQVWGASGGVGSGGGENNRGKGGYSEGCLTLTSSTTLYIYVGQCGAADQSWKFNGGAPGQERGNGSCASGGGGTDISLCGGGWDTANHWNSRIIVAGGGGATGEAPSSQNGGHGGGCSGTGGGGDHVSGGPGTQTGAGGNWKNCSNYATVCAATFGKGGTAYDTCHSGYDANGGGGGWYGGGGGGDDGGGGGGSGYVFTSATVGSYPSGRIPTSSHYLSNAYSCVGNTSFPSPSGGTETGHTGNGCVKITTVI